VVTGIFLLAAASCFDKYTLISSGLYHTYTHTHTLVVKAPVRGSGMSSLKLCSNDEIHVSDVSMINMSRFLIEILVYHLHGSVLFFCGLCKRNDQYKWCPNRHISTSVSHFRVIAKRKWVFCSLWYWHDTIRGVGVYTALCCLCDGRFRIFEFLVMTWLSFRRWFLFTGVIYVYCVCGIHMFFCNVWFVNRSFCCAVRMVFLKYAFCLFRIGSGGVVFKCSLVFMENILHILWGKCGVLIDICHLGVYLLFHSFVVAL
jgi:hypothetical protein